LAYSGQRPGETEHHYIGSQGPQWTAMLDKRLIIPPMLCTDNSFFYHQYITLATDSVTKQDIL